MISLGALFACIALSVNFEPVYILTLGGPFANSIDITNNKQFSLNGTWSIYYNNNNIGSFTANQILLFNEGEPVTHTYESTGDFYNNIVDFTMVYNFYHVDGYDYGLDIKTTFYMLNNITFSGYFTFADVTLDALPVRQSLDFQVSQGLTADYSSEIEQAYQEGLDNGYDLGYYDGVLEGKGVNNVIEWFKRIVDSCVAFFNIEIAPGVTLGFVFGVPIFVGVLWFLLRALIN